MENQKKYKIGQKLYYSVKSGKVYECEIIAINGKLNKFI
jgi:hypothetical protein